MGPLRTLVESHRDAIEALAHRHHGRTIAVFGSVARGDEREDSDIDFLVEFEPGSSLFDLLHLQDELADLLGAPVDVVSAGGLRARDQHIKREAILLA
jgi:predicted nucleotidyltransferase